MTLDEAIKHCEEKSCGNTKCSEEHKQLAEWLKELKQFKCSHHNTFTYNHGYHTICQDCGKEL